MHDSGGESLACFNIKSVFLKDRATWQNRQPPERGKLKIKFVVLVDFEN